MDFGDNIWDVEFVSPDEWSRAAEQSGSSGVRGKRLRRQPGPDSGQIASMARTETIAGGPIFTLNRLGDAVDYFDGESAGRVGA